MAEQNVGTARVDIVVDADGVDLGVQRAKSAIKVFGAEAQRDLDNLTKRNQQLANSFRQQVQSIDLAKNAALAYRIENSKLSESIKRDLLAELNRNTKATTQAASALNAYGLTAKQTSAALRQVPAQLTDIFVSLQGGQAPLTVLLQQGGQLRDIFGGIRPAAAALGAQLLKLVNPYTILAGAGIAVSVALLKATNEQVAFNKALIVTGGIVGKTSDDLQQLAVDMDNLGGVTRASAAEALTAVASTGRFVGDQVARVAISAERMRVATGQSLDKTIDQFKELANDPVKAIVKLNESQHFLTEEVYSQIKALEAQGREQEAATLAINTYADTIAKRTQDIDQNLGTLERGWNAVKRTASEAWDAMLDIGRTDTVEQQISDLLEKIEALSNPDAFSYLHLSAEQRNKQLEDYRAQVRKLNADRLKAAVDANRERIAKEAEAEAISLDQEATKFLSNEEKRAAEKLQAKTRADIAYIKAMSVGNKETAERIRADEAKIIAGIDAKYDAKQKKTPKATVDAGIAIIRSLNDQIAVNKEATEVKRQLTASESLYEKTLNDLLDPTLNITNASRALINAKLEEVRISGAAAAAAKEEQKAKEALGRLDAQLAVERRNAQESADIDLARIGRGQEYIEQRERILKIEQNYAKAVRDLRDQGIAEESSSYQEQLQRLRDHREEMLQIESQYQEDRLALTNDWRLGARQAFEDFAADARNLAGNTAQLVGNAFGNLTDAVTDFAMTSKLSLEQFSEDFIRMAIKITTNRAVVALVEYFLNAFGGGGNSFGTNMSGAGANAGFGAYAAKGAVWSSPELSAHSNQILYKPTTFRFAKGASFGTAGEVVGQPEAIMPLARDSGGNLGVRATGATAGDVYITVENNTNSEVETQTGTDEDGNRTIRFIINAAVNEVNRQIGGMGTTGRTIQQRFGVNPVGASRG